ncbi:MAG: cupin domain-containing protein [Rhodospirillales bacterium]|jgi:uncharacterized protein YjlB|nr:cupin domain-containing protein [Rhodospirillales bacterium]
MPVPVDALEVESLTFADDGRIPNNPALPALLYRGALVPDAVDAAACAALFAANGWPGAWRNGIYADHHFHSTGHEVLGIVAGRATVTLGGPEGATVDLAAGDVVVLPAGTGHKRERASPDLVVVGAYPGGISPDLLWGDPAEHDRAAAAIARVAPPATCPVYGAAGPLLRHWRNGEERT